MRNAQGYVTIFGDFREGEHILERDTVTCGHCNQIVFTKPGTVSTVYLIPQLNGPDREEPGAFCRQCMGAICLKCCAEGLCTPLMRRIEEMEAKNQMLSRIVV